MTDEEKFEGSKTNYVWGKDRAGNEFLCTADSLKDPKDATEEELANCVDDAGHLVPDHHGCRRSVLVEPLSCHDLGEVDAGRAHADSNLAGPGRRVFAVPHLEDIGLSELGNPDCLHGKDA